MTSTRTPADIARTAASASTACCSSARRCFTCRISRCSSARTTSRCSSRVGLDDAAREAFLSDRHVAGDGIHTFLPQPFPIAELAPRADGPARTSIEGTIFRGHFERRGKLIAEGVVTEVHRVVHFGELDISATHGGPGADLPLLRACRAAPPRARGHGEARLRPCAYGPVGSRHGNEPSRTASARGCGHHWVRSGPAGSLPQTERHPREPAGCPRHRRRIVLADHRSQFRLPRLRRPSGDREAACTSRSMS